MRVMRSLAVMSLAVALAAGCNKEFDPPPPPPVPTGGLTATQSFTVRGGFNAELSTSPIDFVLRVDPVAGSMIVGTPGSATSVPVTTSDGISFRAQDTVLLPIPAAGCASSAKFSDFSFAAGTNEISGTATGMGYIIHGDYGSLFPARLDFKGAPDVTPPSIVGQGAAVDPLAGLVVFTTSEPLSSSAQAQLVSPNDRIALVPMGGGDASTTIGFQKPAGALRYDTTYELIVDHWADLAGNPGVTPDGVVTFSAPPLIPADGFESAPPTLGGAAIADANTFAPISGQKSALVGSSLTSYPLPSRFTVRLAVAPGDSVVRFSLRPFTTDVMLYSDLFGTQARLAVPGGEIVNVPLGNLGTSGTNQVTPSGMNIILGDTVELEAPLPSGATDTVVFDFQTGAYGDDACRGAMIPPASYQIDDLRVE